MTSAARVWLFRLASATLAMCVGLLCGEIGVRILDVGPRLGAVSAGAFRFSDNPLLRYEFLPGAVHAGLKINADGMRDRRYAVQKPPDTFRIACIGDSVCAGYQVAPCERFSTRLERLLNLHYGTPDREFEVLNFGVTGYNITQSVENLRVRALKYDPDAVIYAYCLNDPQEYSYEFERLSTRLTTAQRDYLEPVRRGQAWVARHSRLYALGRYLWQVQTLSGNKRRPTRPDIQFLRLRSNTYEEYFRTEHATGEGWGRVVQGLQVLSELSGQENINTYIVVFPLFRDLAAYPLKDVHRKVAAAAERRALQVADLLADFQVLSGLTGGSFTLDDLHPDQAGHSVAAVIILRELLAREDALAPNSGLAPLAAGDEPEAPFARLLLSRAPQE